MDKKRMEKDCEITKHIDESEIKPNGTIYLLTNIINGKVYIGKVSRPKIFRDRLVEHLREGKKLKKLRVSNPDKKIYGTHLHNAIAKYREEVWNVRKIDIAYNKTELNQKERYWIKKYDSMNPNKGYNMTEGGESGRRRPEVVKRISKSVQELWQNKEYQEKQKNARIEMWLNNEYREHIINKCIKKWQDPIYHKNQSEKIRIGMINKWQEPEYLKIQSEKISNSMRKLWKNSKFQNKMQDYRKKM